MLHGRIIQPEPLFLKFTSGIRLHFDGARKDRSKTCVHLRRVTIPCPCLSRSQMLKVVKIPSVLPAEQPERPLHCGWFCVFCAPTALLACPRGRYSDVAPCSFSFVFRCLNKLTLQRCSDLGILKPVILGHLVMLTPRVIPPLCDPADPAHNPVSVYIQDNSQLTTHRKVLAA